MRLHFLGSIMLLLLWSAGAFAQTHEKSYDQFLLQYQQKNYGEMILAAQKLMERIPDKNVCYFFIAAAYDKKAEGYSMFNHADMKKAIDLASEFYTKAEEELGGPEFKAAEPHLEKLIGDKPSKKNVDMYIEGRKSKLKQYYEGMQPYMEKLAALEKEYKSCEEMLTSVAMAYPNTATMYLNISEDHWQKLAKIEEIMAPIKSKLEAIFAEERAAGFLPAQQQSLEIAHVNDDGRNITKTWEGDFTRDKVVFYDMQGWAASVKAKAKGIRDLRMQMADLEKEMALAGTRHLADGELQGIEQKLATHKKEMMAYDKKYYAYLINNYLLAKARYQSATHIITAKKAQSFVHREAMEQMVDGLYVLIDSARERLSFVQDDSLFYINQQEIYQKFGRRQGLENYRINEEKWLKGEKDRWADEKFYAASVIPTIADQVTVGGKKMLVRPVNFDVAKEFEAGAIIAEEVKQGDDGSTLIIGREKGGAKGKQPFVVRFGAGGEVKWSRSFSTDSLDAAHVSGIFTSSKGISILPFSYRRGGKEAFAVEAIANTGERIFWKATASLPTQVHFLKDSEGAFAYNIATEGSQQRLDIHGFGFAGEAGMSASLRINGEVAKMHVQPGQLLIVANATLIEGGGISFATQAGKGSNVACLVFRNDGTAPQLIPVQSPTAIAADMLIEGKGKDFTLKGRKGDFAKGEDGRLEGGEPWEFEYKEKK